MRMERFCDEGFEGRMISLLQSKLGQRDLREWMRPIEELVDVSWIPWCGYEERLISVDIAVHELLDSSLDPMYHVMRKLIPLAQDFDQKYGICGVAGCSVLGNSFRLHLKSPSEYKHWKSFTNSSLMRALRET